MSSISSQNAVRHGCCSEANLLIKGETIEDYKALELTLFETYKPVGELELRMVHQIVNAEWFLDRATRTLAEVEQQIHDQTNPADWTDQQHQIIARFTRYETARANTAAKFRKAFQDHRKAKVAEKTSHERLTIAKERAKSAINKNKPEPTWAENLANMRRQAIAMGYVPEEPSPQK